jgi:adenine-specific DNA-methyltransferase
MAPSAPDATARIEALDAPNYGEVFTRRWVVELILDLCGYTSDRDLASLRIIEPACGSGAFLGPIIERLAESAKTFGRDLASARDAIVAKDLQAGNVRLSRAAAREALSATGLDPSKASLLSRRWIRQGDFLLDPLPDKPADLVVGNPPYIRLEAVPPELSIAYRQACPTMGGRSDVYVGFYERGLSALCGDGVLGFICSDRWMRNAYGARLRELVAREWAVDVVLSMTGVDAFEDEVSAYPAITVLRRGRQEIGPLVADATPDFDRADAHRLVKVAGNRARVSTKDNFVAARMPRWFSGRAGWPHGSPVKLATLASIEEKLPTLEDENTGTRVGIGLASGADRVFVTNDPDLVEPERLLPMALVRDIADAHVDWSGHYLVNPWDDDGLVDLASWPRLKACLTAHKTTLSKRHTARSGKWYKTIDRVIEGLEQQPKLYLPDFKEALFPVLDKGRTYPHHNLYWITSDQWDLEVLGGILLSDVANMFISAYSVRMRGGYLRFQAQYLRRICVPRLDQIDAPTRRLLKRAFRSRDHETATQTVLPLYGLDAVPA